MYQVQKKMYLVLNGRDKGCGKDQKLLLITLRATSAQMKEQEHTIQQVAESPQHTHSSLFCCVFRFDNVLNQQALQMAPILGFVKIRASVCATGKTCMNNYVIVVVVSQPSSADKQVPDAAGRADSLIHDERRGRNTLQLQGAGMLGKPLIWLEGAAY